jgi:hypothetical protein
VIATRIGGNPAALPTQLQDTRKGGVIFMSKMIDMTDWKFTKLKVIARIENNKNGNAIWQCKCDCGNVINVTGVDLRSEHTKSCGCYNIEAIIQRNMKHGETRTRLYNIWRKMLRRCKNSNEKRYKDYGGRGIFVCNEWKDYLVFRDWALSNGYKEDLTIDRRNNDGNYDPDNCRWATYKEQGNNKRNNHCIVYNGKTQTLMQWSEETSIDYDVIQRRLTVYKWSIEKALTTPTRKMRKRPA